MSLTQEKTPIRRNTENKLQRGRVATVKAKSEFRLELDLLKVLHGQSELTLEKKIPVLCLKNRP